jgi:hypothetical protein
MASYIVMSSKLAVYWPPAELPTLELEAGERLIRRICPRAKNTLTCALTPARQLDKMLLASPHAF